MFDQGVFVAPWFDSLYFLYVLTLNQLLSIDYCYLIILITDVFNTYRLFMTPFAWFAKNNVPK